MTPPPTQTTVSTFSGTLFSFFLVVVCSVFISFVSVRTYVLYGSYTGLTDHFNTIGVIFAIFWLVTVSLLLRLVHPVLGLANSHTKCDRG